VDEGRDDVPTGVHRGRFDDVVSAARRGDEDAIAHLFTELHPRLVRFLAARSGQASDDLAGEVWMAVAKRIGQFEGDWDDFRKWLFAIARNRVADHHRSNARRRTIVESNAFDGRWTPNDRGCDEAALDHLSGERAAKIIASVLSPDQAEVVLLRVLGDLDADQVAAIMNRSPGWVRVTQHRALRHLAAHFSDAGVAVKS
jgi:RNA polymerase sigma-70 factor (ECF subfamily)